VIKMDAKEFREKFKEAKRETGWVQIIDREGRAVLIAKRYTLPTRSEYDDHNFINIGRVVNILDPKGGNWRTGYIRLDSIGNVRPLHNLNLIKSKPDYDSHEEWSRWSKQKERERQKEKERERKLKKK